LATGEAGWDFTMLLLTFVTSTGSFAFAGGGTASSSNAFVVCALGVGESAED
jgi:hypothetical protein